MVKGMIFDFDGVIVDTETKKWKDLKTILSVNGFHLKEELFFEFIGSKTEDFLRRTFPEMDDPVLQRIVIERRRLIESNLYDYKLIMGLKALLDYLKRFNCKIAITTGSQRKQVEMILKANSIFEYFDLIVTGTEIRKSKPNPDCYIQTLKKLGLRYDDVIVVEDSTAGIKAAKSAGCTVFGLETYLGGDSLLEADKSFKDHEGIRSYMEEKEMTAKPEFMQKNQGTMLKNY